MTPDAQIAIIGAGIAGLACATGLRRAGFQVSVFDKSPGPSGRMSTRRGEGWQCDHGAQYFTARDPAFRAEVARWEAAGVAGPWAAAVGAFDGDANLSACAAMERFVGIPRMTAPARWLASDVAVHAGVAIGAIRLEQAGWRLYGPGELPLAHHYDALVLAVPAPQAEPLLRDIAPLEAALAGAAPMESCWAMMLQYPAPLTLGFDAAFVNGGALRWVARDSSKPGRGGRESWVLHASAEWSDAHIEHDTASVAVDLLAAFATLGGPAPEAWSAHRWRYARAAQVRTDVCVWVEGQGLGLCGDWLNGGTVEAAWLSGQALARRIAAGSQALVGAPT